MKMKDEILKELWGIKDQLAKENGNDLDKLYGYLVKKEKLSLKKVVNRKSALKNKQSFRVPNVCEGT
jgi:hypothetical protein